MDIDVNPIASREPVASRDTAVACFVQLGLQNGLDPTDAAIQPLDVSDSDSLPISALIEVARKLGYRTEHTRADWQSLQSIGFADPILVLLRNTNVVILTGGGRESAEEVAVWDPLHRDSEVLFVPRQEFERAWSGDLLRLTLGSSSMPPPSPHLPAAAAEQAPDPGKQQPSGSKQSLSSKVGFCLVALALLVTAGIGLFLFNRSPAEYSARTGGSVGGTSERPRAAAGPEESTTGPSTNQQVVSAAPASDSPKPFAPPNEVVAAPTSLEVPLAGLANRAAPVPLEPTEVGQVGVLESPVAGPSPGIPPASGEAKPETDPNASTSAPLIPPVDATLTAAEISMLLTLGDKTFSSGDVASARLYYWRAANAGDGQAALRLGETFDPVFLEHAHLRSARGDLTTAVSWYRRAHDMGIGEAEVLLNSLEAK